MAQPAYDLNNFAPAPQRAPRPRVVRRRRPKQQAGGKRAYNVCLVSLLLLLVVGVLNTQAKLTELQGGINSAQVQLHQAETIYASLELSMESTVNIKTVEERAKELGLVKKDPANVIYVRSQEGSGIKVAKTGLEKWLDGAGSGFLDVVQYLMPR